MAESNPWPNAFTASVQALISRAESRATSATAPNAGVTHALCAIAQAINNLAIAHVKQSDWNR